MYRQFTHMRPLSEGERNPMNDKCIKCNKPATVWWPAANKQWCSQHAPKGS